MALSVKVDDRAQVEDRAPVDGCYIVDSVRRERERERERGRERERELKRTI